MSLAPQNHGLLTQSRLVAGNRDVPYSPTLRARVRASLRKGALDRRLVEGKDPSEDRVLRARAWQLTRPRARERLASALEAILSEVERPQFGLRASVPVCREEVEVARGEIARLTERLRNPRPVRARGVLLVRRLLSDGDSPLFVASGNDELWRQMRGAAEALDRGPERGGSSAFRTRHTR
jgi:hypothetical protein